MASQLPQKVSPSQALAIGSRVVQSLCRLLVFLCSYRLLSSDPSIVALDALNVMRLIMFVITVTLSFWSYQNVKEILLYSMFLVALSPVVRSLAETVSTDTIYALSATLSVVHLFLSDYTLSTPLSEVSLSLNSQIFSSVCLASRLTSNSAVFALMCASAILFVTLARVSNESRRKHLFTTLHVVASSAFFFVVERRNRDVTVELYIWILLLFTVGIALPLLYVRLQTKRKICSGPWDEAVPGRSESAYGTRQTQRQAKNE